MPEATVIVRLDGKLKAAFAEAAKASDRNASQLLRDFMRGYVKKQASSKRPAKGTTRKGVHLNLLVATHSSRSWEERKRANAEDNFIGGWF